jgi:hypothetical protein
MIGGFPVVALRGRRTRLVGFAVFACAACAWLGTAAPANAAIKSVSVSNQSKAEGAAFNGTVATFVTDDPFATSFSFSIDWGDGSTTTGSTTISNDSGSVSGSHTYNEDGVYPLKVTVTQNDGGNPGSNSASASFTVSETDAALTTVAPMMISEGTTFAGPVASFIDSGSPDTASKFSATIDWGDGTTTAGIVAGAGGNFMIGGSHTYTDELHNGVITVTVFEPEGNSTVGPVKDSINVTEADALTAHPLAFPATDGLPVSGAVATFSDPSATPANDFTATISWGDGTTTSGTVSRSGGTLTVSGNHTYNSPPSNYPVNVHLADDSPGTATATAASTANVSAGKPSAVTQGANGVTINTATLNGTVDPNGDATTYSFQYGTTTAYGSTTPSSSAGSGNSGRAVSVSISGLMPGTIYHYRIVATNAEGTTVGADQTFTTVALVKGLKGRRDGSVLVVVIAPGAGTFDVVVVDGNKVFGHARLKAKHAGRFKILVRPNRIGSGVLKHHHHHITLRVTVTFTLQNGRAVSVTFRGLHLP